MQPNSKTLVIVPTYNEAEAIIPLLESLQPLAVDVLIVDDNSPDGTAEIVDEFALDHIRIRVLRRDQKTGLGPAYKEGFNQAKLGSYLWVVQMDADGSHRVTDLEMMLEFIHENPELDLLIGSRWIEDGRTVGWSKSRLILSKSANAAARILLNSSVKDLTAGFKVLSFRSVDFLLSQKIDAKGYGFQIESNVLLERSGYKVTEHPITFVEREVGKSKMNLRIILEAFVLLVRLTLRYRLLSKTIS